MVSGVDDAVESVGGVEDAVSAGGGSATGIGAGSLGGGDEGAAWLVSFCSQLPVKLRKTPASEITQTGPPVTVS